MKVRGAMVALITPFDADDNIELGVLDELVEYHLSQGVCGFFLGDSSGEGLLLSQEERMTLTEAVIRKVDGRGSVIVHVGAPAFKDSVEIARHAQSAGADAIAAIPPIYFTNDAEGIVDFYSQLARRSGAPLYAYHIPGRTGSAVTPEILTRLRDVDNIVGIKYTDPDLFTLNRFALELPHLNLLAGGDETLAAALLLGADAGIGSTYNLLPGLYTEMIASGHRGDFETARELQYQVNKVIKVLIKYGVMAGIKASLREMGFDCGECRAPVQSLKGTVQEFRDDLSRVGFFDLVAPQAA